MSGLIFDIDLTDLVNTGREVGASTKQIQFAISYAMRRTATTLRTMSARGLKSELELRTIALLRKRLKTLRLRNFMQAKAHTGGGIQLWYGLNDMPASWFKGTPKKTADGAEKRGQNIAGGFIGKSKVKGRRTIFKRVGEKRLPIAEQNLAIEDKAIVFIEDKIFDQVEEIFWKYFVRDVNARVSYRLGER